MIKMDKESQMNRRESALNYDDQKGSMLRSLSQSEPRILVVDDDPVSAQAMLYILSNLGMNVSMVFHGLDALESLSNEVYDLLILDWRMPEMNGSETIQALFKMASQDRLQQERLARMPVIIYSGLSQEELDAPEELEYFKVTHFLPKPSSSREMIMAIRDALARVNGR